MLADLVQRGDEQLGGERDDAGGGQHHQHGHRDGERRLLVPVFAVVLLRHGLSMRHELEEDVRGVGDDDDDGAQARDGEDDVFDQLGAIRAGLGGEDGHQAEGEAGQQQHGRVDQRRHDREGLHLLSDELGVGLLRVALPHGLQRHRQALAGARLGGRRVRQQILLLRAADEAAAEEGHPEHQQQVREHGPEQRRLDRVYLLLAQQLHHEDHLHGVAESGVEEARQHVVSQPRRELLRSIAQDLCQGYQGDEVEPKDSGLSPV
mmetsp:Transcript_87865/g.243741  ORF Transcript_87865/g.243741 Transcript_87865/m.243741 type:complete len:263 (+) Transcript_87865:609-1397(+)